MKWLKNKNNQAAILAGILSAGLYSVFVRLFAVVFNRNLASTGWSFVIALAIIVVVMLFFQRSTRSKLGALSRAKSDLDEQYRELEAARADLEERLDDLGKWEGIESATGLIDYRRELDHSDEHPREKIHTIRFHLDFMGNGGSKWSGQRNAMESMLEKMGGLGGEARMLLLQPDCDVCKEASKERFANDERALPQRIIRSLVELDAMRSRFRHLQIKLYDHTPFFRLTFIDKQTVIVGHYQEYWHDSAKTPLLVWDGHEAGDWSFYVAFRRYFDAEWDLGKDMTSEEINKLAQEYGVV